MWCPSVLVPQTDSTRIAVWISENQRNAALDLVCRSEACMKANNHCALRWRHH